MNRILLIQKSNYKNLLRSYNSFCKNKNNNIDLVILTTAITRPELHKVSFNNYKIIIPKNINIQWIINIDYVEFDTKSSVEEMLEITKNNIVEIFNDFTNIDFKFILNKKGNFNEAVRTITTEASKIISNNCKAIFYLEDDWICIDENININKYLDSNYDVVRLHKDCDNRKKITFQPSIIKPFIWYYMFYTKLKKNNDKTKDPEKICQIMSDELNNMNFKYQLIDKFKDIGRKDDINDSNTIRGWFQKSNDSISLSYINIDKLIRTIVYLLSNNNKNLDSDGLYNRLKEYLDNLFLKDVMNRILTKFLNNKDINYNYYQKCVKTENKKNKDLKYIYNHIDSLIITGA